MLLTKEALLSASDVETHDVDVPEWGGTIRLRLMTADDLELWQNFVMTQPKQGMMATLLSRSIVDEAGKLMFTADEVEALGNKSAAVMQRLFKKAVELNAMTKETTDALSKNS